MSSSTPASSATGRRSTPSRSAARATATRVDAVGLAAIAAAAALAGHQPGRDPDDALAADEQEPLERARDVPAVLDRPHPLVAQAARPLQRRGKAARRRPRPSARRAARRCAAATAAIVCERLCMSAPSTIMTSSLSPRLKADARRTWLAWGRCHAPIKSRRGIPDRRRATQRKPVRPTRPTA